MSGEQVIRSTFAAYAARDWDRLASLFAEGAEIVGSTPHGERRVFRGTTALAALRQLIETQFDAVDARLDAVREADAGRVFADGSVSYTRKGGGGLGAQMFWVFDVDSGRITRVEAFASREDALAAAGLRD